MRRSLFSVAVAAAFAVLAPAAEIKSGPQTGEKVPGPFHPLNINGASAGEKNCLYCQYGDSPVAMVFARSADCECTAKLIKKLEAITAANSKSEMGAFVVFLSDDDKLEGKLKTMAEEAGLKNVTLAIDNPAGPKGYNLAKDADLTVVLYSDRQVKANHSFAAGKLTDKDLEAIAADVSKILPKK